MNKEELARIAQLAAADGAPMARALDPEVRSGASFTFDSASPGAVTWPRFKVVWFFTVKPADRVVFETRIGAFESAATPGSAGAPPSPGVTYLGTYSVTISAAAPDFEYRTVWGLDSLAAMQDLNDLLHTATGGLRGWLDLIAQVPAMRSEIMGRTFSSILVGRS
jgi:hypothetical protein